MTPHAALQAARDAAHAEGYAEIRAGGTTARHVLFRAERSAFTGNPKVLFRHAQSGRVVGAPAVLDVLEQETRPITVE